MPQIDTPDFSAELDAIARRMHSHADALQALGLECRGWRFVADELQQLAQDIREA